MAGDFVRDLLRVLSLSPALGFYYRQEIYRQDERLAN
jgi:hypothetical protein